MVKRWLKFRAWISKENKWRDINIWLVAKNSSVDYINQVERKPVTKSQEWPIFNVQKKKTYSKPSLICRFTFYGFSHPQSTTVQKQMLLLWHILRMSTVTWYHNANNSPHFVSSHRHLIISRSQEEGWVHYNKLFWEREHIHKILIIVYCITVLFYY